MRVRAAVGRNVVGVTTTHKHQHRVERRDKIINAWIVLHNKRFIIPFKDFIFTQLSLSNKKMKA